MVPDDRKTLACARALAGEGIWVAVGGDGLSGQAYWSSAVRRRLCYPHPAADLDGFYAQLQRHLDEHRIDVILPMNDYTTHAIARVSHHLPSAVRTALPAPDALGVAACKHQTLALATQLGVETPRTHAVSTFAEFEEVAARIAYPCVCKLSRGSGAVGLSFPSNRQELLQAWRHRHPAGDAAFDYGTLLVQEWVPGETRDVCVIARHGDAAQSLSTRRGLFPYRNFSGFADPEQSALAIAQYRPAAITGHPGFLDRICTEASPATLSRIRSRLVACAGENLLSSVRAPIADVWQTRVADFYAAHEFNLIAWEREADGPLEVSTLTVAAETLPDPSASNTTGPRGELIGTALWSFAAPIIRYRLGDDVHVSEADPHAGLALRLLKVLGRRTDRFLTLQGDTRHAYQVVETLLDGPFWFQCYLLEQNAPGHILVRFVPLPGVSEIQREQRAREFGNTLALDFRVDWEWVPTLPPETNGKRRLFARNIPLPGRADR